MTLNDLKVLAENSHILYNNSSLAEPILELFRKEHYYFELSVALEAERNAWKEYALSLEGRSNE